MFDGEGGLCTVYWGGLLVIDLPCQGGWVVHSVCHLLDQDLALFADRTGHQLRRDEACLVHTSTGPYPSEWPSGKVMLWLCPGYLKIIHKALVSYS